MVDPMLSILSRVYNVLGRVSNYAMACKKEPAKSYGIIQNNSMICVDLHKIISTWVCANTLRGQKHRQLTSKAIDINFACDILI